MNHIRKALPTLTSDHARNTSSIHVKMACPALTSNHGRNTSWIHVRKAQHSHLTMRGSNPSFMSERLCTYIRPCEEPIQHTCRKGSSLTSDHARNQSNIHVERALHLHSTMRGTNPTYMSKGYALTSNHARNQSSIHVERALHLHLTMGGTNPTSMLEGMSDSLLPFGGNLDMENTKLLPEVLKLHSG